MEAYADIQLRVGELEGQMAALKQELRTLPRRILSELDSAQRLDAARYLYWLTDLPVDAIAESLDANIGGCHIDTFLERIGPYSSDVDCDRCKQPIEFQSRSQMREVVRDVQRNVRRYAEGYRALCANCWTEVQQARFQE